LKNSIPAAIGPILEYLRCKILANLQIRLRFLLLDLPKSSSISHGAVLQRAVKRIDTEQRTRRRERVDA
jgi:hypothetical protein